MDLSPHIEALRRELSAAASAGSEETRRAAELLSAALGSAARLMIMDVLSQAAEEITAALPGGVVEVRLRGRDPEIVVGQAGPPAADGPAEAISVQSDADTVRVTLRLPEPLKNAVEDAATRGAVSVNSWLVKAVKQTLDPMSGRRRDRDPAAGPAPR